jgi:hypothetical protein
MKRMPTIIALAGIQEEIYDATSDRVAAEVRDNFGEGDGNIVIIGTPVKLENLWNYHLDQEYKEKLLGKIWENIQEFDLQSKIGISIAHATYEGIDYSDYKQSFCPFALTIDFEANPNFEKRKQFVNEKANQFTAEIVKKFSSLISNIGFMRHELNSRRNNTPCLLPVRNFQSDNYADFVQTLFSCISTPDNQTEEILDLIKKFEKSHPRQRTSNAGKKLNYVDDRNLIFQAPGKALHGHPQHKLEDAHKYQCLINGVSRFGVGFERSYHYDCVYDHQPITGNHENCHDELISYAGREHSHINISPNDYVR